MNESNDKLNKAFADIDSKYIALTAYTPKFYRGRKRICTAVAACLAVTLTAALIFALSVALIGGVPTEAELELLEHTVTEERIPDIEGKDLQFTYPSNDLILSNRVSPYGFFFGIVVEARVTEVLPDVYISSDGGTNYHILKLEVLDVLCGENMPKEFYYRLPLPMSAELEGFDSLILEIAQVGLEDYIMVNDSTKAVEKFTLMFETSNLYGWPNYGTVFAFTNGWFDTSLWELDGWDVKDGDIYSYLENGSPVKKGYSRLYAKYKLEKYLEECSFNERSVYYKGSFTSAEAIEAIKYIESSELGIWDHSFHLGFDNSPELEYSRSINGFKTNEYIVITNENVSGMDTAFTKEELEKLPDLSAMIDTLDLEEMTPPHTKDLEKLNKISCNVSGCYVKANGKCYGIVAVVWDYCSKTNAKIRYYDDTHYLALPNGSFIQLERDELREYVGNCYYISNIEYNVGYDTSIHSGLTLTY